MGNPERRLVYETAPSAVNPDTNDIITVAEVAAILRCQPSSVYNLTRKRAKRYKHTPLPVIRLPLGLRFKRSSILQWLDDIEERPKRAS